MIDSAPQSGPPRVNASASNFAQNAAEAVREGAHALLDWRRVAFHRLADSSSDLPSPVGKRFEGGAKKRSGKSEDVRYREFRGLLDTTLAEVDRLRDCLVGDVLQPEAAGEIVEIQDGLQRLYRCKWGEGECLKRVVVAIQSQTNNADWTAKHVHFLRNALRAVRARFVIDDGLVRHVIELIREQGLDQFRGTVAEPVVLKKYKIEELQP
jgi:hypothetical protein